MISDPFTVSGLYESGKGTEELPYEITSFEQLIKINANPDAHFVMKQDIELPVTIGGEISCDGFPDVDWCESFQSAGGWQPIGTNSNPFTGTFDGGGHTITNLTIQRDEDYQGMFGHVNGGHIQNLILEDATVDTVTAADPAGKNYVGLLAGKLDGGGSVTDVEVSGEVTGYEHVGGLIGSLSGIVSGAKADVEVTGKENNTGGLIGENYGTVTYSLANGNVVGGESCGGILSCGNTGGLIGNNHDSGSVSHVYATGSVEVHGLNNYSGGLIGRNRGSVTMAFATGSVSSPTNAGGLIGWNNGEVTKVYATGSLINVQFAGGLISYNMREISDAYATGTVSGKFSAGLVETNFGTIQQSYYYQFPDNGQGIRMAEEHMKLRPSYENWTFVGDTGLEEAPVWIIDDGVGMPQLFGMYEEPGSDTGLILTEATPSVESLNLNIGDCCDYFVKRLERWNNR